MHHVSTEKSADRIELTGGWLVALSRDTGAPSTGGAVPVGVEGSVIGRADGCAIVVADPQVSLMHCELQATEFGVRLRDLNSKNGTYVHQARLAPGGSVYLMADARVRCGQTWFALHVAKPEAEPISTARHFGLLVGRSIAMRKLYTRLARLAPTELSVLIEGETGTGKELVARSIHDASRRQGKPFVIVDCTTIAPSLAESKLFGHERGAFTGATERRPGALAEADGGTVFFDELGELPPEIQPKLLRALESRQIQSVGSNRYQSVDVRVVAATRRDMHAEINASRFRDDLYYRLAQVVVKVPPLRERRDDIADLLVRFFADLGDPGAIARLDPPSRDRLMHHDWPGNARELRNVIAASHAQSDGGPIDVSEAMNVRATGIDLANRVSTSQPYPAIKQQVIETLEREYFAALFAQTGGNVSEMARRAGIARATVRESLDRVGLRGSE
jgi:DNA-binding NtrC family response regulator